MSKVLRHEVLKVEDGETFKSEELLVCEREFTIFLDGKKLATLLCTPEHLNELAIGFLRTQEILIDIDEILDFKLDEEKSLVNVKLDKKLDITGFKSKKVDLNLDCNLDYEDFLDSLNCNIVCSDMVLESTKIYNFMEQNLNYSDIFKKTGGVHSVALADVDEIKFIYEDVARHNALDKVIGRALIDNIYLKDKVIVLSGRVSLEMILKCAKMQIPIIISKSAPTTLSVKLANKLNITLIGFVRGNRMNIYSNASRIKL